MIFGAGIDPAKLEFRNDPHDGPNDLLIVIKDSTDSIRIRDYFKGDDYRLDSIQFADGTIWDKTNYQHTDCDWSCGDYGYGW